MGVWSLVQKDLMEKEMATHSSILACGTPWTEEPGMLQSHEIPKEMDTTYQLNNNLRDTKHMYIQSFIRNSQSESESGSGVSDSSQPHGLHSLWNYPGQNTAVDSFSLPRGSSQTRDQTQLSHIEGGFFTSWAIREAHNSQSLEQLTWPSKGKWRNTLWYIHTTEYYHAIKRMHSIQLLTHMMICQNSKWLYWVKETK